MKMYIGYGSLTTKPAHVGICESAPYKFVPDRIIPFNSSPEKISISIIWACKRALDKALA
jgi:hypothetical protein